MILKEIKYEGLEQEASILKIFEEMKNPNSKKVKKLAASLQ